MLVMDMGRRVCVECLAFAPDGRALAAACDAGVFFWPAIADATRAKRVPSPRWTDNIRFSADGRWLFTGRYELWRIEPATGATANLQLWGGSTSRIDASPTG